MNKTFFGLLLMTSLGALAACGAAKQPSASPMAARTDSSPAGASPAESLGRDPKVEIEELSANIDAQRSELGLAEPAPMSPGAEPATPMATIPLSTDASCKPAKTERCEGSCKLSDSICTNASRICELAKDLVTDDGWAANKCARANKTCEAAHERCCSCQ